MSNPATDSQLTVTEELRKAIANLVSDEASSSFFRRLCDSLPLDQELEGPEGTAQIKAAIHRVESKARAVASTLDGMAAYRLLRYVLPSLFSPQVEAPVMDRWWVERRVAEYWVESYAQWPSLRQNPYRAPQTEVTVDFTEAVARLWLCAKQYSGLRSEILWLARGQAVTYGITEGQVFPEAKHSGAEAMTRAIESYQTRTRKHPPPLASIFGQHGFDVQVQPEGSSDPGTVIPNLRFVSVDTPSSHTGSSGRCYQLSMVGRIPALYKAFAPFRDALFEATGTTPEAIFSLMALLTELAPIRHSGMFRRLEAVGYAFVRDPRPHFDGLSVVKAKDGQFERPPSVAEIHRAYDLISRETVVAQGSYDFPSVCVRPLDDWVLCDFSNFWPTYISILSSHMNGDGGSGINVVSHEFESQASAVLGRLGDQPFAARIRVVKDGGETLTDLDASVKIGDILVVGDCQSLTWNAKIQAGDFARMRNRLSNLRLKLAKWDSQWLEVASSVGQGGLRLHDLGIKAIFPIVVTPGVELFASEDPRAWIDSFTPRVLAVEELGEISWNTMQRHPALIMVKR